MKCTATKRNGEPCTLDARGDAEVCWAHDPANREKRKQIATKAGKSKTTLAEIQAIKRRLKELTEEIIEGKVDKAKASVAIQGLGVLKNYFELERRIKEIEEIEARLAALEQANPRDPRGSRTWGC